MAKNIVQFRFYGQGDVKNYPNGLSVSNLTQGTCFNSYMPIKQLGIQAPPGTKFYLNNSKYPIIVGATGIYELDLDANVEINSLKFSIDSINKIGKNNRIDNNTNSGIKTNNYLEFASLIVDILYETGGVK